MGIFFSGELSTELKNRNTLSYVVTVDLRHVCFDVTLRASIKCHHAILVSVNARST